MTVLMRPSRTYGRDDANRVDQDTVGSNWRQDVNPQPRIRSNGFEFKTMSSAVGRAGDWVSFLDGPGYDGKFRTDSWEIRGQLKPPSSESSATDNASALIGCVPDTIGAGGSLMVYFVFMTGGGCAIYTQSGTPNGPGILTGQSGQTARTGAGPNVSNTGIVILRRVMYSATQSIFTAWANGGTQVAQWNDSGGLVPTGPTNRRWGFAVEGNRVAIPAGTYRSPCFDWIEGYDLW